MAGRLLLRTPEGGKIEPPGEREGGEGLGVAAVDDPLNDLGCEEPFRHLRGNPRLALETRVFQMLSRLSCPSPSVQTVRYTEPSASQVSHSRAAAPPSRAGSSGASCILP